MTPESRSARPATATVAMISRTVATEIAEEEDSAEVAEAAADEVAGEVAVAAVVLEVAEATRTGTTITATAEAEMAMVEVETATEVAATDTAGIMIRMEKMATKMVIVADSVVGVVEAAEDVAVVEEVAAGTLEVAITEKRVDSADEAAVVDSGLVEKMTITTTKMVKSKWTNLGSCTFRHLRPKTRTKSSAPASAPVSILINLTILRSM